MTSMENTIKLQDRIIESLHNFIFGNCIFCGKEYTYTIEIKIEELNKTIEIKLCKKCYQIKSNYLKKNPILPTMDETIHQNQMLSLL